MAVYKQGDRGEVVKEIQRALKQAGFGVIDDGIWGPITTEAVMAFQSAKGLKPDGIVGPATMRKMNIASATPNAPTSTVTLGGVTLKRSRRAISDIVIHCTATPEGMDKTVEQIRAEHKRGGWSDIGYHYVVTLDGALHLGRDVDVAGAHVSGHNANTIGIAYVGGLENAPGVPYNKLRAKDTRTPAQRSMLVSLLMHLRKLYPYACIRGHRDFSPDLNGNGTIEPNEWIKECPSFDAKKEYREL